MSSTKIDSVNTETYLNEGSNSMREMLENHNNIVISSNKINKYKNIETSLFHKSKKKRKKIYLNQPIMLLKNYFVQNTLIMKMIFQKRKINSSMMKKKKDLIINL